MLTSIPFASLAVFQILMAYQETKDWKTALPTGIPARKGFIPKPRQ